jgi:hypothetical protein
VQGRKCRAQKVHGWAATSVPSRHRQLHIRTHVSQLWGSPPNEGVRMINSYLTPVDIVPALNVQSRCQQNWQSHMAVFVHC